jgi:hypothetical protein
MMKYLIASKLDDQLQNDAGFMSKWIDGKFTAAERRILITEWAGDAWEDLCNGGYIRKNFEKTGCLIGTVGARVDKINIQGLPEYQYCRSVPFVIELDNSSDSEFDSSESDSNCEFSEEDVMNNEGEVQTREGDVIQVLDKDNRPICKGTISAPRETLHGQAVPTGQVVVLIQEVLTEDGLGFDSFGEPIGAGAYFAASASSIALI